MEMGAHLGVDLPLPGERGPGWFRVRGWSVDAGLPVLPRFQIGGRAPASVVVWPAERPDVAAMLGAPERLRYGFDAWVRAPYDVSGETELRVLIDTHAGPVSKEVAIEVTPERARIVVDEPGPLTLVQGTILLHGWTYGYATPVREVRVEGPGINQIADFGIARLEIAAVGASAPSVPAGFQTRISLHATVVDGPVPLAVVVEDVDGVAAVTAIGVRRAAAELPEIALERLVDHGAHIELEGFVAWPAPAPRSPDISVEVDDRVVATTVADRARPDALRRLPDRVSTPRCGFVISVPRGLADHLLLRAQTEDGRIASLVVPLAPAEHQRTAVDRAPAPDALAKSVPPGSTVLDWGVGVAAAGVPVTVASPPCNGELLPYRDRTFDFVAIPPGVARRAEALRVAATAALQPVADGSGYERLSSASGDQLADTPAPAGRVASTAAGDGSAAPRALIVAHRTPATDLDGAAGHALKYATWLLAEGWAVTVIAEAAAPGDAARIHALEEAGVEVWAGPESRGMRDHFLEDPRELVSDSAFAVAVVQFWGLAERWAPLLRTHSPGIRVLIDSVDLHLLRVIRGRVNGQDGPGRLLDVRQWRPIAGELNAYADADAVLTVSDREAGAIDLLLDRPGLSHTVPLARPQRASTVPEPAARHGLLFAGNFGHPPNVMAVRELIDGVLPLLPAELRRRHPLRVVGSGLAQSLAREWDAIADVEVVGWVPSLTVEHDAARVFVAPLPMGAGVKNKVLDAMASGLPVVTNGVGAEGLAFEPGRDLLLGDTPEEIAAAIVELVEDEARWSELSQRSLSWIAAHAGEDAPRTAFLAAVDYARRRPSRPASAATRRV